MASPTEKTLNALLSSTLRIEKMAEKSEERSKEASKRDEVRTALLVSMSSNIEAMKNSLDQIQSNSARAAIHLANIEKAIGKESKGGGGKGGKIEVTSKGLFGLVTSALLFKLVGKQTGEEFTNFVADYIKIFVEIHNVVDEIKEAGPALYGATKGIVKSIALLALATPLIAIVTPFVPTIKAIAEALAAVNEVTGSEENFENAKRARKTTMMQVATLAFAGLAIVGLGMLVMTYPAQVAAGIGVIAGLALVFSLIGLAAPMIGQGSDAVMEMGMAVGIFGLGFLVAAASFALAGMLMSKDGGMAMGVLTIGLTIVGLGLAFALIGLAAPFIISGSTAVAFMGGGLAVFGIGFAIAAALVAGTKLETVAVLAAAITGVGLAMAGVGFMSIFILPGVLLTAGMGLALASLTWGMDKYVNSDAFDKFKPKQFQKLMKELAKGFEYLGEGSTGGTSALKLLTGIDFGKTPIERGISAAGGIGRALSSIAQGVGAWADLQNIPKIKGYDKNGNPIFDESQTADVDLAIKNVITVFTGDGNMKKSILYPFIYLSNTAKLDKGTSLLGMVFGGDFGKSPFARGVKTAAQIGPVLTRIAEGMGAWVDLSNIPVIVGYDEAGNPKYGNKPINLMKTVRNVVRVLDPKDKKYSITKPFIDFSNMEGNTKGGSLLSLITGGDFGSTPFQRGVATVGEMGKVLGVLAEGIGSWAEVENLLIITGYDNKTGRPVYDGTRVNIKEITGNITFVMKELAKTFEKIAGPTESKGVGGWLGFTSNPGATVIGRMVAAMEPIGDLLSSLAEGFRIWADVSNLKIVEEIVWDPKTRTNRPKYSKESINIKDITNNITYVLTELGETLVELGGPPEESSGIGGWFGMTKNPKATTMTRAARAMAPVGDMLSGLAEGFKTWVDISNIKIVDEIVWDEKAKKNRTIYSKESVDINVITDNIKNALTMVGETLVELGGPPEESGGIAGWFGMTKNPKATTMTRAARAMAPVGDMLSGLAEGFKTFAEIENIKIIETYIWDENAKKTRPVYSKESVSVSKIAENIKMALTTVGEALVEVGGPPEPAGGIAGWIGMTKNPKTTTMKRAANAMAPVGDLLGGLAEGFKTFAEISNIKVIETYRWDEKAQKNVPVYGKESVNVKDIAQNVKLALTTVGDAMIEVGGDPEPVGGVWGWLSGATKNSRATTINRAAKAMAPIGDLLGGLAEGFKTFAEIENIKIIETYEWNEKAQKNIPIYSSESVSISKIANNIKIALTTVADALVDVAGQPKQESAGLFGWLKYDSYPRAKAISRAAKALGPMGEMLGGFAQGMETFANIQNILQITGYKVDPKTGVQTPIYGKPVNITQIAKNVGIAINKIADALVSVAGKPQTVTKKSGFLGLSRKTVTTYPRAAAIRRAGEALMPMSEMLVNFAEGMKAFANIDGIPLVESYEWSDKAQRMLPKYGNTKVNIGQIGKNIGKAIGSIAGVLSKFNWYENYKMRQTLDSIAELPGFLNEFADGIRPWANVGAIKPIVEWKTDKVLKRRVPVYGKKAVSIDTIVGNIQYSLNSLLGTFSQYTKSELKSIEGAMKLTEGIQDVLGDLLEGIMLFGNFDRLRPIVGKRKKVIRRKGLFGITFTYSKMVPVFAKERVSGKKIIKNIRYALINTLGILGKMGKKAGGFGSKNIKTGVFAFEHMAKSLSKLAILSKPFERFSRAFMNFSLAMGIFVKSFKQMDVEGINAFKIWTEKLTKVVETGNASKPSSMENFLGVASDVINSGFGIGDKLNKNDVKVEKSDGEKEEIIKKANEGESPENQMMLKMTATLQALQAEMAGIKAALGGTLDVEVSNMPSGGFPGADE